MGPKVYGLIREDLKVYPYTHEIAKAALSPLLI